MPNRPRTTRARALSAAAAAAAASRRPLSALPICCTSPHHPPVLPSHCAPCSANKKGGHDRPDHRPHPPIEHDPVKRCIKKDNCLSHGWHSVCAKDVLTGNVGAFPNRW